VKRGGTYSCVEGENHIVSFRHITGEPVSIEPSSDEVKVILCKGLERLVVAGTDKKSGVVSEEQKTRVIIWES
jgi:hypothetical protein